MMELKPGIRLLTKLKTSLSFPTVEAAIADYSDVYEVEVEELSPSGRYVKLIHKMDEGTNWFELDDLIIVEVLENKSTKIASGG